MKGLSLSRAIRVQPFTGLVIDVDTWAAAHDYHRHHQQLHLLSFHGGGIAQGLEVLPTDPPGERIVVEPGVAADSLGNVIVLPEAQRLTLEATDSIAYIGLDYVESLPTSGNSSGSDSRGRLVEDFRLRVLSEAPQSPSLELARIQLTAASPLKVTNPSNPRSPGADEIDTRFRANLRPQVPAGLTIGLVTCGPSEELDEHHLEGVHNLIRELGYSGLRTTLRIAVNNDIPEADLLYVTGSGTAKPTKKALASITARVKNGAWLLVDTCGPGVELVNAFSDLAKKKAGVEAQEDVLRARFIFGEAPEGASGTANIAWGDHSIMSARDFGCAWAGRHGNKPIPRETIRSAFEFGVNVAVLASA